ncbi:MauE/DoxX family redox-associated membrane protein [Chthonobacter rhizosphaerae]|uniref:MauE/DoxX family redox-associated membrane protein n=1 Tax=Chthonobacter rhizosphaerae TaxID=2735553 RepID=UPI0015EEF181|nr:MauE/DoxX family redox-associated membrane protein [Chthonobacter rhizosphaerae]
MTLPADPLFATFVRAFLVMLFLGAAMSKLPRREEFYGVVRNFRILPEALARPVALALPVAELVIAGALLASPTAPAAALAAAALLAVFGVAIAVNVLRGRTAIDCGCLRGGMKQPLGWMLVARNGVFAAAAVWLSLTLSTAGPADVLSLTVGTAAAALAMLITLGASLLGGLAAAGRSQSSSST